MGAASDIEAWIHDPKSVQAYERQRAELGDNPSDDVLLKMRLIPDPRQVRLRVYQTNSTHKSMSALRQGSMLIGQWRFAACAMTSSASIRRA
jgi:arginine decarboxylase